MINDILDFSKIEAGRVDLDLAEFDLVAEVEEVAALLAGRAHEKGLELVTEVGPGVPPVLLGDAGRLRQVLVNLVGNAVKFTERGEVAVRVAMESDIEGGVRLRFEVCDTGIGVPEQSHDHILDSFAQADASTTRTHGGSGLGLAISKQLVELMGGQIGMRSQVGVGSTFWFTVVLTPSSRPARSERRKRPELGQLTVLVVDDNGTNRDILDRVLRAWGLKATVVGGGSEALHLLRGPEPHSFDVGIIDYHMPGMDGVDLARAITLDASIPPFPLVMLTSSGLREDWDAARAQGVARFLTKPVRQSALYDALVDLVHGDDAPVDEPAAVSDHRAQVPPSGLGLLVVEDNAVNRQVARRMLESRGHRVDLAGNGQEAIAALRQGSYDVILMDCQMPVLDGFDATRAIRASEDGGTRIPIIAMTAGAMPGDRERCLDAGMDDYVAKPVRLDDLDTVLARWISRGSTGHDHDAVEVIPATQAAAGPPVLAPEVVAGLKELDQLSGGLGDLIRRFLSDTDDRIESLLAALIRGAADEVARVCHSLRGSAGSMGALRLAALCGDLERSAVEGRMGGDVSAVDAIRAEHELVRAALMAEFPGG